MLSNEISPFINDDTNKKEKKNNKNISKELISPINYTWKGIFKLMNKIKLIWHMNKFNNNFTLNTQSLNKFIYSNLKYCNQIPNLRLKNNILESDINSFFQTNLFDFLTEEQELYDYYDKLFNNKQYIPKNDENEEILYGEFITNYRDLFYNIQKDKKSMRQLKKLRWYQIMDEDNFFGDDNKINKFNLNSNDFFLDFSKEIENNNDSFDEIELKMIYDEYAKSIKEKKLDNLDEIFEKNIINDVLIDKLLKNEKNPFFYIIKLIYLSINIFCKATICHLLNYYSDINEEQNEDGKSLINQYLLCFNNFVDSCILINRKCKNINVVMNYLYNDLYNNYPNSPKFSIFRMCIRIWFVEANTHLIGENTLLSKIKDKICSIFSSNLKEELYGKMKDNLKKNKINTCNSTTVNFDKSKSFSLTSSFMLFKSNHPSFKTNDFFSPFGFGSQYINSYNNSDKQYKILDKGLSIINDTFSNEYSVFILNLSNVDINSFYNELINNFNNSIKYYIVEIFNVYLNEQNCDIKEVINNILKYFDNYFFKTRILSNLKKNIYEKVFLELKNNLLEYTKNKYLDNNFCYFKKENNFSKSSISTKSNLSTNNLNTKSLLKSSILNFNNDFLFGNFNENTDTKYDTYKKEIITYIQNNTGFNSKSLNEEIDRRIEDINERINIYELFESIDKWHKEHMHAIKKNDRKIMEELINVNIKMNENINIPLTYNKLKRYLLSFSLQYDWAFIKKVKNIEKYLSIKSVNENDENDDNDDIEMTIYNDNDNENDNNIGIDYFNNLDNIENINNNF